MRRLPEAPPPPLPLDSRSFLRRDFKGMDQSHLATDTTALCRVTYRMTDQMGIVYYGNYMEMFEMGRTHLMKACGHAYTDMERDDYRLAVIHAACDYVTPARYDDLLSIRTWIEKLTRARVHFGYEIRQAVDQSLVAHGVTHHVYLSPEGKLRRLDQKWMDRLKRLREITANGAGTE